MPDMRGVVIGVVETVVLLAVFFALGAADWVGGKNEPNKYCETVRTDRMIRQPVNTFSNVAAIIVGWNILMAVAMSGRPAPNTAPTPNPMAQSNVFPILYGCAVIWLGPGSMFLHASQKHWGGWLDNLCMDMYVGLLFAYNAYRCFGLKKGTFCALYLSVIVVTGFITLVFDEWGGIACFGTLIVLAAIVEVWGQWGDHFSRSLGWLIPAVGTLGLAFWFWWVSRSGHFLCKPDSIWQGHAAWHILTGFTTLFLFLYLRSEKPGTK